MTIIEKKQWLMEAFSNYERWIREGKPMFRAEQYYYDDYHSSVKPVEGQVDTYRGSIQTYDSPMGDTWWQPIFRMLNGNTDVELLSEEFMRT